MTNITFSKRVRLFRKSTLYMNALYLMLSTFVVAASGFIFWVFVAHKYETSAVGLATTLLSVSGLLSLLGLAGFDTTFVRFLPRSKRRNDYINSGLLIVTLISAGLAVIFALILPIVSPHLAVLRGFWPFLSFVFFTVVTSLNILTNAVFLAFKKARYIFAINASFGVFRMILPLLVAAHGSAMTIFALSGSAQLIGLILSIIWMMRTCNYHFFPRLDIEALRVVRRFSYLAYVSSVLNLLPPTLLPLFILYRLGASNAAYYYMAFTIASVLYTIAYASMQSVFAEGSHNEAAIHSYVAKATKLIGILLLPAAVLTILLSGWLLTSFGHEYSHNARMLLQLFALSALPVAIYSAMGAIFKVAKNLRGMVSMNFTYVAFILGLSFLLVPRFGLIGVGWAWLFGNMAACCVGAPFLITINKSLEKRYGKTSAAWR